MALDPSYASAYALAATCHGERFYEGTVARSNRRPDGGRAAEPARALLRPLRSAGAVACAAISGRGCSTTTTMPSSCSTARWRPIPARPSPGCAAAPPSATSARRARRGAASRSGSAVALRRACLLLLRAGRARGLCRRRLPRGGDLGAAGRWRSIRASSATCASWPRASPPAASSRRRTRSAGALLRVNPAFSARQVRRRACLQGCREAAAVRRSPGDAGGAAGVRGPLVPKTIVVVPSPHAAGIPLSPGRRPPVAADPGRARPDAEGMLGARRLRRQVHDGLPQGVSCASWFKRARLSPVRTRLRADYSAPMPASRCRNRGERAGSIPTTRARRWFHGACRYYRAAVACRTRTGRQIGALEVAFRRHAAQIRARTASRAIRSAGRGSGSALQRCGLRDSRTM